MTMKVRIKGKVIKTRTNEIKYYFSKKLNVISWKTQMKYMFAKTENGRLELKRKRRLIKNSGR